LFEDEHVMIEKLLKFFVREIYTQLLEAVELGYLKMWNFYEDLQEIYKRLQKFLFTDSLLFNIHHKGPLRDTEKVNEICYVKIS
jgi:hypothetical protein